MFRVRNVNTIFSIHAQSIVTIMARDIDRSP